MEAGRWVQLLLFGGRRNDKELDGGHVDSTVVGCLKWCSWVRMTLACFGHSNSRSMGVTLPGVCSY